MENSQNLPNEDAINKITYDIIGASFEVRRICGKGLIENYYEAALAYELGLKGHKVDRQVMVPALYKGVPVKDPYKIDILVDDEVIVELKSLPYLTSENFSQLATYLWLTNKRIGLLINFSAKDFRTGAWDSKNPDYKLGIVRVIRSQSNSHRTNC